MRDFTKLKSSIWHSERFRTLTDSGKVFYLYALSSVHANAAGYYRLPIGWAMEDIGWNENKVLESMAEVEATGLIGYSKKEKIIFIDKHFDVNGPTNPKHASKVLADIISIPYTEFTSKVISNFSSYLNVQPWKLLDKDADRLSRLGDTKTETFTLTSTSTSTSTFTSTESTTPLSSASPPERVKKSVPDISSPEIQMAVADYNSLARSIGIPAVIKLSDARKTKLKARIKDLGGLQAWGEFLQIVGRSKFLRGGGEQGWKADLDFLLQEKSFNRIREGYYDERKTNHARPLSRSEQADAAMQRALDRIADEENAEHESEPNRLLGPPVL